MQGLGPVLIVYSEDDVLAPIHVVCGFARRLIELGTDVKLIKWSNSPHVGAFLSSSSNSKLYFISSLKFEEQLYYFCSEIYDV
jgi:acetyl esterase/lipase